MQLTKSNICRLSVRKRYKFTIQQYLHNLHTTIITIEGTWLHNGTRKARMKIQHISLELMFRFKKREREREICKVILQLSIMPLDIVFLPCIVSAFYIKAYVLACGPKV